MKLARSVLTLLAISAVSWVAGLASYIGCLKFFWGQRIGEGDLQAVVFWSAVAVVFAVPVAYAPAMFALRRRAAEFPKWWLFPSGSIALGVVPVMMIVIIFEGSPGSAEAVLFYCLFAAFGAVFGAGFHLAYVRRSV